MNPKPENEAIPDVEEIEDVKEIKSSLSYVFRINDFMARNEIVDMQTVYYLYKYDDLKSEQKSFIDKFVETDPPDEDYIGKCYGGGRYLVMMAIAASDKHPDGLMRAYKLKIHSRYDKLVKNNDIPSVPSVPAVQQPQNSLSDSIDVVSKLIAALSPLFAARQQPAQSSGVDFTAMLFKNYEQTSEVLKKSMLDNVKLNTELQSKMLTANNGESEMGTETEEMEPGLIEQLKPLLIEWLPKLIGTNPESKAVQTMVKAAPQLKQIVNNKVEYRRLIKYLDQAQGVDVTNKILANLKLKRA